MIFQRKSDGSKNWFINISGTELAFCAISRTPNLNSIMPGKQCNGMVAAASDGNDRQCTWR